MNLELTSQVHGRRLFVGSYGGGGGGVGLSETLTMLVSCIVFGCRKFKSKERIRVIERLRRRSMGRKNGMKI